jgi:hypothetical protein
MKTYLMLIIAAIVAAGLAGCASESQYSVQLFGASRSGHLLSIVQTSGAPSSKYPLTPRAGGAAPLRPLQGDAGRNEAAAGQRLSDGEEQVGHEPGLDDIAQGSGRERGTDKIWVGMHGQKDDSGR